MDNILDKNEILEKARDFIKNREGYYKKDRTDFRRSKNLAAGNGWFERLSTAWGEARSNLTLNPLQKMVDSTCNTFLRNPIVFDGLSDELNESLTKTLFKALRDVCNDGIGYVYIYHDKSGNLLSKNLANTHVLYSKDQCIVIDKQKSDGKRKILKSIWNNTDVLALQPDEIPVITFFDKNQDAIDIYRIIDDEITQNSSLNLPYIPIVRVKGKLIELKEEHHYRGYYYVFQDTVAAINAYMSRAAEMAIAKTPVIMAEESMPLNARYQEAWESNEPRNLYLYKGLRIVENMQPLQLPPPTLAPYNQDLGTLNQQITMLSGYIDQLSGMNQQSEAMGNETATAVLDRRQSRQDAQSELLFYLNNSAHKIAKIIEAYSNILGKPRSIKVINRMDEAFRNKNSLDLYMSLTSANIPASIAVEWMKLFGAPYEIISILQSPEAVDAVKNELAQKLNEVTEALKNEREKNSLILLSQKANLELENKKLDLQMALDKEKLIISSEIEKAKIELEARKLAIEEAKLGIGAAQKEAELQIKAAGGTV